jgi:hypothetical protein
MLPCGGYAMSGNAIQLHACRAKQDNLVDEGGENNGGESANRK